MIQSTINKPELNLQSINWNTPQLVICVEDEIIILTSGDHNSTDFSGTVMELGNSKTGHVGEYSTDWDKKHFVVCPPEVEVKLFNK